MLRAGLVLALAALSGCRTGASPAGHGRAKAPRAVAVRGFRIADPDAVVLITGGTHGMMEVCNCVGPMPGGLARRSGLVRSYRAAFDTTIVLDTGDLFWVEPEDLRNTFVPKGYGQIGYDAVVLGDQEWAACDDHLRALGRAKGLTCLSTTVSAKTVDFPRVVVRPIRGGRLAIVSDVRGDAFRFVPASRRERLTLSPPEDIVRRIRQLKRDGLLVMVVAHMEASTLEAVAGEYHADLIVQGHTTRSEPALRRLAGTPVVKVGGFETVGAVAIRSAGGKIVDLDYRVEVVDTTWPLDRRLIQTYQAYAHAAMRRALDAERTEGLDYVASSACGKCHPRAHAAWRRGPHAHAYKTLVKARRTGDPNCLMCHTTGFGTKKGFYTIAKTPRMADVNCQACHRFNVAEHRKKGFRRPAVTKAVCTTCHTPVTSPKFDYAAQRATVRCPAGTSHLLPRRTK